MASSSSPRVLNPLAPVSCSLLVEGNWLEHLLVISVPLLIHRGIMKSWLIASSFFHCGHQLCFLQGYLQFTIFFPWKSPIIVFLFIYALGLNLHLWTMSQLNREKKLKIPWIPDTHLWISMLPFPINIFTNDKTITFCFTLTLSQLHLQF